MAMMYVTYSQMVQKNKVCKQTYIHMYIYIFKNKNEKTNDKGNGKILLLGKSGYSIYACTIYYAGNFKFEIISEKNHLRTSIVNV